MPRKAIIFVRHGESEYNKECILQNLANLLAQVGTWSDYSKSGAGQLSQAMRETGEDPLLRDAKLTERGRAQARQPALSCM